MHGWGDVVTYRGSPEALIYTVFGFCQDFGPVFWDPWISGLGFQDTGISGFWDPWISGLGFRDFDFGIFGFWDFGISPFSGFQDFGIPGFQDWDFRIWGFQDFGISTNQRNDPQSA